ncbi:hypothetical protein Q604_UNBC10175G0001, partial [human gut metagenome]
MYTIAERGNDMRNVILVTMSCALI